MGAAPPSRARRRVWSLFLALVLAVPLLATGFAVTPASAVDGTGVLTLTKSVTGQSGVPTYSPGATFSYTVRIGCSNVDGPGCGDAKITDVLPAPLVLDPAVTDPVQVTGVGTSYAVTIERRGGDGHLQAPLGGGDVGLQGGDEAVVTIQVKVPEDTPSTEAGLVTNNARATQSNGQSRTDSADVQIDVPEVLEATVSKSVNSHTPSGTPVPAVPGQPVTWTIGGANTSNRGVDSLVIQDPADGSPDPFQYLAVTGISTLKAPTGADRVQVDWRDAAGVWHPGSPVAIPANPSTLLPASPDTVHGLRFTLTSSTGQVPVTAAGGAASITYETETRANVTTIPANTTVTVPNTASSVVTNDGARSAEVRASASVQIRRQPPTNSVTKAFEDPTLTSGQSTTATLTAVDGATPVSRMVIAEPAAGTPDLAAQGLRFDGFTSDLEWPPGATGAQIQYSYADGFVEGPRSTTTVDTLPARAAGHRASGFVVTFTGTMPAGATAIVPFTVTADKVTVSTDVTATNTTSSQVFSADGQESAVVTASDDLTRQPLRVSTTSSKNIVRNWNWAVPGSSTLVAVPAAVDGPGPVARRSGPSACGSRTRPTRRPRPATSGITTTCNRSPRPTSPATPSSRSATGTAPGGPPSRGGRRRGAGVRLHLHPARGPGGHRPGHPVRLRAQGRRHPVAAGLRRHAVLPRGAAQHPPLRPRDVGAARLGHRHRERRRVAGAQPDAVIATDTDQDQDSIELRPLGGGPGTGPDMIDKGWLLPNGTPSHDQADVVALTDDQRTARLLWSTQYIPLQSVTITDPSGPPGGGGRQRVRRLRPDPDRPDQ